MGLLDFIFELRQFKTVAAQFEDGKIKFSGSGDAFFKKWLPTCFAPLLKCFASRDVENTSEQINANRGMGKIYDFVRKQARQRTFNVFLEKSRHFQVAGWLLAKSLIDGNCAIV